MMRMIVIESAKIEGIAYFTTKSFFPDEKCQ